jgi:hypothetical protein
MPPIGGVTRPPLTWSDADRIRAALFRDRVRLYAILDGARSEAVFPLVENARLPSACLYEGELPPVLRRAAPYLVALEREAPFVMDLIAHSWRHSWGVFCECALELPELRAHLRSLLRVNDTAGHPLLFRYYDPRVLRAYLPTCTADEARQVFGPVSRYLTEGEDPRVLLEFARGPAGVAPRVEPLGLEHIE